MNDFVVRSGNPTPEEIAIAISVLRATAGATAAAEEHLASPHRTWAAPAQQHRQGGPHRFGPRMWTLSQRLR